MSKSISRRHWFRWLVMLMLITSAVLAGWDKWRHRHAGEMFPWKAWPRQSPEQAGFDAEKLEELSRQIGGYGCITRNGFMVFEWGHPRTPMDVGSAGKPIIAHFVLKAVEAGLIPSLDSPVAQFEPELAKLNAGLGFKDKRITWRHLLYQTACYGQEEEPGTAFDYNDFTMNLLWRVLFTKVYKSEPKDISQKVLNPLLATPAGFQDGLEYLPERNGTYLGRFAISAQDFCRFGLLYMREGRWREQQLLSASYARMAVSTPLPSKLPRTYGRHTEMIPGQLSIGTTDNQEDHRGSYSCLWWINGLDINGRRLWPDAPSDTFGAFGYGGNRTMVVIPSSGIVASWTKSDLPFVVMSGEGREQVNRALRLLMNCVIPSK
ncbi:MAG: serine hydrolase [Verrucomicrobiaceae bacterium]